MAAIDRALGVESRELDPDLVREYDISRSTRDLLLLRVAQFALIYVGLFTAASFLIGALVAILSGAPVDLSLQNVLILLLGVGGLYALVNYPYLITKSRYPIDFVVLGTCLVFSGYIFLTYFDLSADMQEKERRAILFGDGDPGVYHTLSNVYSRVGAYTFILTLLLMLGIFVLAFRLRSRSLSGKSKLNFLEVAEAARGIMRKQPRPASKGRSIDRAKGIRLVAFAISIYFATNIVDLFATDALEIVSTILAIPLSFVFLVLLLRARQYFQLSSESFLDSDKRAPILFLRSFADDTAASAAAVIRPYGLNRLLDFSIETRLASYFLGFGPFIAVGSPKDTMPQLGAPRVRLSDANWHVFVERMIGESEIIVMMVGLTQAVAWELETAIRLGATTKLLLLFPRPAYFGPLKRVRKGIENVTLARFERVRVAFAGTRWSPAIGAIAAPERLFALTLYKTGKITAVKGTAATNDAFDLAAEIAHLCIRGEM